MRVAFIGTGDIGVPTLEWLLASGDCEVAGVITQPDRPAGRRMELLAPPIKVAALRHHASIFQPERIRAPHAIEQVRFLRPDVIVVMAYGQILPIDLLQIPRLACINLHASLLPRHRGASPVQAAIECGDRDSGVTVMHVGTGLDTGDILLKRAVRLRRRETGGSLHERLALLAPSALAEALKLLRSGTAPRIPQDNTLSTYAPKLSREHGWIDWSQPAHVIERKIRAMNPWPGACTALPQEPGRPLKLKIFAALPMRRRSGKPGEVLEAKDRGLVVAAGEGALLLKELQLEGKKRMPAADLLRGCKITPGTILAGTGIDGSQ